jgi:sugar/nucleoside kinase (ribokinase family)
VNYLNDNYISENMERAIVDYLRSEISSYDIVLVSDFGHGFITEKIIKFVEKYSKKFAVNTQTNGANAGYNMITKYRNPTYVCLDESEIRLSAQDRYGEMEFIVRKVAKEINSDYFIVTRGRSGSVGITRSNGINRTPVFSTKVVDTVGAGDAFFAYTAPCMANRTPLDMVSFIGNAVGALAVQIVGNKKPVEKYEFLEFAHALLKER